MSSLNRMKHMILIVSVFSFFLLLFIFPEQSVAGGKKGLLLWFEIIIPTLLPFMILSNLMIQFEFTKYVGFLFYPLLRRLLGLSKEGCYPFIIGLLSGMPMGAKTCSDMIMAGKLSESEGQFLIGFCNNASPMFILSFVSISSLGLQKEKYLFLFIILISSLLGTIIYRLISSHNFTSLTPVTAMNLNPSPKEELTVYEIIDRTILSSFQVLVKVGGYIIMFSILANIILHITCLHSLLKYIIVGCLEITTGVHIIGSSSYEITQKIVLIGMITTFGGFSGVAQTKSVINSTGLSLISYIKCKIISASISGILLYLTFNIL